MTGLDRSDVVILGTGHGGAQAAIALRQQGFEGSVTLIGREPELPYERPPLSKEYLEGSKGFERLLLRPASFWATKDVGLRLGTEIVAVDSEAKRVRLSDGTWLSYGKLIWAGGGVPRRLACHGADLAGVHTLRSRADVDGLKAAIASGARRAAVVGGGYIGLEAAAVLRKLGCEVVLVEALPRLLARVAGTAVSSFFEEEHRAHGVDLRLRAAVECIEGDGVTATGVALAGGEVVPCDLVIVGIGIVPEIGPLAEAKADIGNGVRVDEYCRTSLPDAYAVGDCAEHSNRFAGGAHVRLESVQNATDMATVAAKHICGKPEPYQALPWFWSNQYDLKLQTAGLSFGHDEAIVRGDPRSRSFSVVYLKQGRIIALDCVNSVKDYVQGRKLVEAGTMPPAERISDPGCPLKNLIPSEHAGHDR